MSREASWYGRANRNERSEGERRRGRLLRPAMLELEGRRLLATLTVTNTAASGAGSLAAAITQADADNQANTIVFAPADFTGHETIPATNGLWLSDSHGIQAITGPAQGVTISGEGMSGVLVIGKGTTATLTGLTITRGLSESVGGILINGATVTITNCTFSDNSGAVGGLDNNGGTVTISGCTFSDNVSEAALEGTGGGFSNSGTATITDTTFALNTAGTSGGAIANYGTASLVDCTVSGNSAGGVGGGIYEPAYGAHMSLQDTIVAGNTSDIAGYGASKVTGSNDLIGILGFGGIKNGQDGDIVLTSLADLGLAPLGSYGGPTQTMALLPGSAAIGAGAASITGFTIPTTDQRGISRPRGAAPDIGAFESQGFSMTVTQGNGQTAPVNTAFARPLSVTVSSAHGEPVVGGVVTFTAPGSGASAKLSPSAAVIGSGGVASASATALGAGGAYKVTASAAGAAPVSFTLTNLAQPVFTVANDVITYGTDTVSIAGTIAAGGQFPRGNVTVTLDGVSQNAVIGAKGAFSASLSFAHSLGVGSSPYTVSYSLPAEGYFLAAKGTSSLTVNPAVLSVTAASESMTYGRAVPVLAYTYTGLVNGDKSATFTGGLATPAKSSSNAGIYAVTKGTLAATGNYTIGTFHAGRLTVNPAPLVVTAANETMITGSVVPALSYTFTGLVNGDKKANFNGRLTTTATSGSGVGKYPITLGTLKAIGNYTIGTFNAGTLTVVAAPSGGAIAPAILGSLTDAAIDGLYREDDFAEFGKGHADGGI